MSTVSITSINDYAIELTTETKPEEGKVDTTQELQENTIENEIIIQETNLEEPPIDETPKIEEPNVVATDLVEVIEDNFKQPIDETVNKEVEEIGDNTMRESIEKMLSDGMMSKLTDEITTDENVEELSKFIEETLMRAVDESIEPTQTGLKDTYFWMTYFYLQFCGFKFFMKFLTELEDSASHDEIAMIVVELVDEIAENAEYLHYDDALPELMAKNLIWKILNCRKLQRRYLGLTTSQIEAADILDEIIDRMQLEHTEVEESLKTMESTSLYEMSTAGSFVEKERSYDISKTAVCREFAGIFNVADYFVTDILEESADFVNLGNSTTTNAIYFVKKVQEASTVTLPSIESFTTEVGKDAIRSYMCSFNYTENWSYYIEYLMAQSDGCSDYFFYEMKLSLPTPLYPVPPLTASIYFKIEVSRVKPSECPIDISYRFEGNNLVHTPYNYPFCEMWLFNILESKRVLFKTIKF